MNLAATLHLWHVPLNTEWKVHHEAYKAAKAAQIPLCPGCRVSFDFVHVAKEAQYQREWHSELSKPEYRGRNFFSLAGFNGKLLKPTSRKGGHGHNSYLLARTH